jgi:hypothetical protein
MGNTVRTDYCVYTHLRPDDSIFYVGKGVPTRPYRTDGRSFFWKNETKNKNHFVNIVKSNLTEAEAFVIEVRLIKKLKEAGIQLVNQTRGGDGCKELVFTEEVKQKLKTARANQIPPMFGKTTKESTKKLLSLLRKGDKNPMYGKKHTEETKLKFKTRPTPNYWTGKKFSKEHKAHLSEQKVCPHCNKIGKGNAMNRYHMDNCKFKESL